MKSESIILKESIPAVRIPSGEAITLEEGQEVTVTQSLGGSVTVLTPLGMARIGQEHLVALGLEAQESTDSTTSPEKPLTEEELKATVWERLKTVYDPEIPVNIVDLGLVYSLDLLDGGKRVEVDMTLTAPGCGMGPTIQADAQSKVLSVPGVEEAEVRLVWEPAWNQDMITEHGKMKLGLI